MAKGKKRGVLASSSISKRGNVSVEVVVLAVLLFAFAVGAIVIYASVADFKDDILDDPDISDSSKAPLRSMYDDYPKTWDSAFLIIFVVIWIASVALATQIDTYLVFFGISVLALIVSLVIPPILANAYSDVTEDAEFSAFADSFPAMNFVLTHLLEIIIVMGASISVALYARPGRL